MVKGKLYTELNDPFGWFWFIILDDGEHPKAHLTDDESYTSKLAARDAGRAWAAFVNIQPEEPQ